MSDILLKLDQYMSISVYTNGSTLFRYTNTPVHLPGTVVAEMHSAILAWQKVFPVEHTFVQEKYGVPTLLARFDGVIRDDGTFFSYEIQDAPGGVGYAGLVSESFKKQRDHFVATVWPQFMCLSQDSRDPDEALWLDRITLEEALQGNDLLLCRYPWRALSREYRILLKHRSVRPMR